MAQHPRSHLAQAELRFEARSSERFDRIAYTMELLRHLNPPLTVAVYSSGRELRVERGRNIARDERWALFGVPPHATRENIARALGELSDLEQTPFLVDLLSRVPAERAG